jgi:ferritin-like metal-binding protein YciE
MTRQARELLEHGLKDMYDAEHRFADALTEMIDNATDRSLEDSFRRHRDVTKEQARRLETAFKELGSKPQREACPAAQGLVKEYQKFVGENQGKTEVLDAFAATAALKVEHYEIATYRSLVDLAEFCDLPKAARVLKQNLAEEEQTAAEAQSAATKLGGELAGASNADIARRAAGGMFDHAREYTLANLGTAKSLGEKAVGDARKVARKAERRGRTVVKRARAQGNSTTRKTKTTATRRAKTTASRAKTTARRATTAARSTTRRAKASTTRARKTVARSRPAARKGTTTARRRSSTGPKRKTASRGRARSTARR